MSNPSSAELGELYRSVFDHCIDGVVVGRADGSILRANAAACRALGYSEAQLIALGRAGLAVDEPRLRETLAAREANGSAAGVLHFRRADGSVIPVEITSAAVPGAGGEPLVCVIFRDVAERERAAEALRTSRRRLEEVLEVSTQGFWDRNLVTGHVVHSARLNGILGRPEVDTDVESDAWLDLIHPDDLVEFKPRYEALLARSAERLDMEFRLRHADGSWRWVRGQGRVVAWDAAGKPIRFLGTVTDIQARKRVEEALRTSEERFRALASEAPVGIVQTDVQGHVVYGNRVAHDLGGLCEGEPLGAGWEKALHPEDRERITAAWCQAVSERRALSNEYRFITPAGKVNWVRGVGSPLRDGAGQVAGFIVVLVDITEQRALQAQLAVASRLAALGTLVAGMAHEINNPLAAAIGSASVAAEEVERLLAALRAGRTIDPGALVALLAELAADLAVSQSSGERVARIVKDLTLFACPDPKRTRIRIADVVGRAMRWVPSSLHKTAELVIVHGDPPDVLASEGQLVQVLVNLVANAADAIGEGRRGHITIRTGPGRPGTSLIEVIDDGAGIEPAVMERMFDPFFTTHDVGRGMGLGLPVCHAIVSAHGGTITPSSAPGQGSTFRVELPVAGEDPPAGGGAVNR